MMLPEVYTVIAFLSYNLSTTRHNNLQVNQRVGPFEGSVLNGGNLIPPQINFKEIGQISKHAIRLDPHDLIVVQNPVGKKKKRQEWNIKRNNRMRRNNNRKG
jgi:hypothetical protein